MAISKGPNVSERGGGAAGGRRAMPRLHLNYIIQAISWLLSSLLQKKKKGGGKEGGVGGKALHLQAINQLPQITCALLKMTLLCNFTDEQKKKKVLK